MSALPPKATKQAPLAALGQRRHRIRVITRHTRRATLGPLALGVSKFVPITYKQAWALVRDVDAAMNVQYTCK
jgi:predicted fused transcriptional regulator/phosphomethylpyrimidine kinase